MAREIITHFHYIHHHGDSQRGFTLLELVFTVVIMGILIAMAAPSFNGLIESNKVKRLATEIEWLLVQAKSEAVMRGDNVEVQVVVDGAGTPIWSIISRTTSGGVTLAEVSSDNFSDIELKTTFRTSMVTFNKLNGKPNLAGSYRYSIGDYKLKTVLYTITGRIYTCLQDGSNKLSNYEFCE
ncbi:GspH/FimT family pseudopilin [Photobacterium phosphoreum]|uniref:GspH/FimT family pseudopilin n=1 Tax=Photobacterium phosphoreum TaxID=659 RepID=UPI0009EE4BD6|nr:GspH/FimT family pseudopilin [Photobacterium phosphoreum]PSW32199.1 prepilin-type N-terminal cleavage/methylation domain-containing protein [Photobacterium phosphoreum]